MNRLHGIVHHDINLFKTQLSGVQNELHVIEDQFMVTQDSLEELFKLAKMKRLNDEANTREQTMNVVSDMVDDRFYSFLDDLKLLYRDTAKLHSNVKHLNDDLFELNKKFRAYVLPELWKPLDVVELTHKVLKSHGKSGFPTAEEMEMIDMKSLDTGSDKEDASESNSLDMDVEHHEVVKNDDENAENKDEDAVNEDGEDSHSQDLSEYDTISYSCSNIPDLHKLSLSQQQTQTTLDDFFSTSPSQN